MNCTSDNLFIPLSMKFIDLFVSSVNSNEVNGLHKMFKQESMGIFPRSICHNHVLVIRCVVECVICVVECVVCVVECVVYVLLIQRFHCGFYSVLLLVSA